MDSTAFYPLMKAVRTEVVVKEGSNVTLTCHGWNVMSHDTTVLWKFNGHEIQGNANKDEKFQDDKTTGTFSLYIKNVSRKGVGTYTCLAKVADIGKTHDDEDYVRLSLDKKDTIYPVMKAVYTEVVAEKGSDVNLTCHGWNVERQETRIIWKFNGHEIQGNTTNKGEVVAFLDDKKGTFSLYIRKVSAKDVGIYTCLAKINAGIGKTDDGEDNVTLSLGRKDTTAFYPLMKAVRTEVVVKEGSNVTLTCHGWNVMSHDTTVLWTFNGHEIQGNANKDEKFQNDKTTGTFSLYIKNVSRKDVGTYTCLAKVADIGKTHDDEDYVRLSLDKKDTTAMYPVMKADRTEVAVNEGSNVTLTCRGWNVERIDTTVLWKFNGHEIRRNTNKKEITKFQNRKRGKFSLYIQNVSRKDVGIYTCLAMVSGTKRKTDDGEVYVKLSLPEKGNPKGIYLGHNTVQTDSALPTTTTRPTTQRQQNISTAYGPTTTSGTVEKEANGLTSTEITIVSAFGSVFFIVVAALAAIFFKKNWAGRKPNIPDDSDEEEIQPYATVQPSWIFPLNDESNGPGNNDIPLETSPSQLRTPQEERATGRTELGNSPYENTDHLGEPSVTPVGHLFYQPRYENEAVDSESRKVVIRPGYDKPTPATTNPPCEYDSLIRETDLRCTSRRGDITDTEGEDNMNTYTVLEVPSSDERTPACSMDKKKNQENSLGIIKSECIENVWKKETLI